MGGCATKPVVTRDGDIGEPPAAAPEPAKEDTVAVSDTKAVETTVALLETVEKKNVEEATATATAVVVVQEGEDTEGAKKIVMENEEEEEEDQVSKRKSLGLLFNKENEEKKPALESENLILEPEKPVEPSATGSSTKEPDMESKLVEAEKSLPETEPEKNPAPAAVAGAVEKAEQGERVINVAELTAADSTDAVEKKAEEEAAMDELQIKV
ncbi:hypothetical protein SAY87_005836 [Trapa incisa]|uniref:Uncharacterized protein n=1 Tax=Trapa incisa TaxID=236973 RepID=A0AAN7KAJ4_9MYRT|nr:hypothetical protein SAY87_005836 [Trapa incisa]